MNELALFAGAGGGILGGKLLGWRTVCAVEIEPFCRRVLMQRQNDGMLDPFPIWDDVRTFCGTGWRDKVDVVTAGFPCQPFSAAGKQLGADDERNLWPDTIRVIREVRPRFAFLENVPALISSGYFGTVVGDLASGGFDCRWTCLSASYLGLPFKRNRVWVLASANSERRKAGGLHLRSRRQSETPSVTSWPGEIVFGQDGKPRKIAPGVPLLAHGVAFANDRLRATGNGQVPAVVRRAWEVLSGE